MATTKYTQDQLDTAAKFLQAILTNPTLAGQYADIIQQNQGNVPAISAWLASVGYPNIDPTCIYLALEQMRDVNQAYWTGIYGITSITTDKQKWLEGPVLIIQGNTDVYLDNVPVNKVTYAKSVLSWDATGGNATAAKITLSQITGVTNQPLPAGTYVGPEFSGTLTKGGTNYTAWTGKLGTRPNYTPPAG
ncbi:MAG: hypothetical protein QOK01_1016, partial [Alphaproteobacteria bacterium]|nr:hypothetical protein [Alphaproteobacteria bacterium]